MGIKFLKNNLQFSNNFQSIIKKGSGLTELLEEFNLQQEEYGVAWIDLVNRGLSGF